jgi:hypothetical protein
MSTPRKLNEIQQRTLSLSDLLFTANPSNGIGGRSTLQALRDLLFQGQSTPTPLNEFSDITQLLANTVIQTNYFALVVDATDDPAIGDEFWALYQYRSGARNELDSYRLIGSEKFFMEGGIPEAPIDGKTYGRKDGDWVEAGSNDPIILETFSSEIDLSINSTIRHSVTEAIAFTLGTDPAPVLGKTSTVFLVSNGINAPTFSADFEIIYNNYLNTSGRVNRLFFQSIGNGKALVEITYI